MHYKNGRLAREGDFAVVKNWRGNVIAGVIHDIIPGVDRCNAMIAVVKPGESSRISVTLDDCLHAEDALAAYEKSVEPAPQETAPENSAAETGIPVMTASDGPVTVQGASS